MSYLDNFLYNYNNQQHQYEYRHHNDNIATTNYANNRNNNTVDEATAVAAAEVTAKDRSNYESMKRNTLVLQEENEKLRQQLLLEQQQQQQKQRQIEKEKDEELQILRNKLDKLLKKQQRKRKRQNEEDNDNDDDTDDEDQESGDDDDDDETEDEDEEQDEEPENMKYITKKCGFGHYASKNAWEMFLKNYQLLKEFKEQYGTLTLYDVPYEGRPDKFNNISYIMTNERRFYKRWKIQYAKNWNYNTGKKPERIRMLEELGFEFNVADYEKIWDENFNKLQILRKKYGHCCVPVIIENYKDDDIAKSISRQWIWRQRRIMKELLKHRYAINSDNNDNNNDDDDNNNNNGTSCMNNNDLTEENNNDTTEEKEFDDVAATANNNENDMITETVEDDSNNNGNDATTHPSEEVEDSAINNDPNNDKENNDDGEEENDEEEEEGKTKKKKRKRKKRESFYLPIYWSDEKRDRLLSLKCAWWTTFEETSGDFISKKNGFPRCLLLNSINWYRHLELFRKYVKEYGSGLNADFHLCDKLKRWVLHQRRLHEYINDLNKSDGEENEEIKNVLSRCEELDWNKEMLSQTDFVFDKALIQEEIARKATLEMEKLKKEEEAKSSAYKLENAKRKKQQAKDIVNKLKEEMKTLQDKIKEAEKVVQAANKDVREAQKVVDADPIGKKVFVKPRGGNDTPHGIATVLAINTVTVVGQKILLYDVQFEETGKKAFHIDGVFIEQIKPIDTPPKTSPRKKQTRTDRPKTRSTTSTKKRKVAAISKSNTSKEQQSRTNAPSPRKKRVVDKKSVNSASTTTQNDSKKKITGKTKSTPTSKNQVNNEKARSIPSTINAILAYKKWKEDNSSLVFDELRALLRYTRDKNLDPPDPPENKYKSMEEMTAEWDVRKTRKATITNLEQLLLLEENGKDAMDRNLMRVKPSSPITAMDEKKAKELIESTKSAYKKWKNDSTCLLYHDLRALLRYTRDKFSDPPDPPVSKYRSVDEMRDEWDVRMTRPATIAKLEQLLIEEDGRNAQNVIYDYSNNTSTPFAALDDKTKELIWNTKAAYKRWKKDNDCLSYYELRVLLRYTRDKNLDPPDPPEYNYKTVVQMRAEWNVRKTRKVTIANLEQLLLLKDPPKVAPVTNEAVRDAPKELDDLVGKAVLIKPRYGNSTPQGVATVLAVHNFPRNGKQLLYYDVRFHDTGKKTLIYVENVFVERIHILPNYWPPTKPTPFRRKSSLFERPITGTSNQKEREVANISTKPNTCKEQQATAAPSPPKPQVDNEKSNNTLPASTTIQIDNRQEPGKTALTPTPNENRNLNNDSPIKPNHNNMERVCNNGEQNKHDDSNCKPDDKTKQTAEILANISTSI